MYCAREVQPEEILPQQDEIIVVGHPWHYNKRPEELIYDRNPKSVAYIPVGEGKYYVCGGVNGGRSHSYLKMIHYLNAKVQEDLANGVIALWHDESHLNRYIIDFPEYRILSPSFCYQETAPDLRERVIVARNKRAYFNLEDIKPIAVSGKELNRRSWDESRIQVMNKALKYWVQCAQAGKSISTYLLENGLKDIIVYGYKNLGELLISDLKKSDICIKCVIDKNADTMENQTLRFYEQIPKNMNADLIIVAAVHDYCRIKEKLDSETDIPSIALDDLLIAVNSNNIVGGCL